MSFILEQLKKSGKKRALEMAMRSQTEKSAEKGAEPLFVSSTVQAPGKLKRRLYVVAAIFSGAVALYGAVSFVSKALLLRQPVVAAPKESIQKRAQLPAASLSVSGGPATEAHVEESGVSRPESHETERKKTRAAKTVLPVTVSAIARNKSTQAAAVGSAEESVMGATELRTSSQLGPKSSGADLAGTVVEFKQLPQAVRKSLPDIKITSHLYRKDSRLVSINGRIMSEGYNMDDGLYLEEITPEGAILSYGKHRFLVRSER